MFLKVTISLLICCMFQALCSCTMEQKHNKKIKISLYYESLCPDCHIFITNQLVSTWNSMKDYMTVELVPYGNAERNFIDGHWKFTCQHGLLECEENLIDSCAVQLLQDSDPTKLLNFVNCMTIHQNISLKAKTKRCTWEEKLDIKKIKSCVHSPDADELTMSMAKKTENVTPRIDGVPAVQIDGIYDPKEQDEIDNNLKNVICKHLGDPQPDICNKVSY